MFWLTAHLNMSLYLMFQDFNVKPLLFSIVLNDIPFGRSDWKSQKTKIIMMLDYSKMQTIFFATLVHKCRFVFFVSQI